MARFDRQIATALRLIEKNGQAVIWNSNVAGAPADPTRPWLPAEPDEIQTHDVSICFLPIDRTNMESMRYIFGTEVQGGSSMGLMGQVPFATSLKDTVTRGTETLRVKTINELEPNGQIILHWVIFE